ncbi:MAG: hypothetical protein JST69_01500 [Bacteroidetes bacterium]|nr:hypothetical protein [Bacteroidota bacterium]
MKILISFFAFLVFTQSHAQKADTIVTMSGSIICSIKEVSPEIIAYTNPNESVIYKIEKGAVAWISFGTGRKEKFNDLKSLANISDPSNWEKVDVASAEYETRGLHKIDVITVKATGTTQYSSANHVQNRAYEKLKKATALLGGNLVYLNTNQAFQSNNVPTGIVKNYRAQISGEVYCSQLIDTAAFRAELTNGRNYTLIIKIGMRLNDADIHNFDLVNNGTSPKKFQVNLPNFTTEKGFAYFSLPAKLLGLGSAHEMIKCRVLRFDQNRIVMAYRKSASIYNFAFIRKGDN